MMFRKRKPLNQELPENIVRRAKMIPTPDLLDWAENALFSAHRNLSAFRSNPEAPEASLRYGDAKQATEALLAVLNEVEGRTGIKPTLSSAPAVPSVVRD